LDLRETLGLAAAGGLAIACVASLALAGRGEAASIDRLDARVAAVAVRTTRQATAPSVHLLGKAPPLFPILSGSAAAPEAVIRLEGLARSPQRVAALVAVNGAPAAWLSVGETRDGVTLEEVAAASVTVATERGPRTLVLGQGGPAPAAPSDAPPAGLRAPAEPASAPPVKP